MLGEVLGVGPEMGRVGQGRAALGGTGGDGAVPRALVAQVGRVGEAFFKRGQPALKKPINPPLFVCPSRRSSPVPMDLADHPCVVPHPLDQCSVPGPGLAWAWPPAQRPHTLALCQLTG